MAELSADLQLMAEQELGETPHVKIEAVARLRTILAEEPDLKCPTDERFLVKFLRSRKFRVQDTFQVIRNYFHVRTEHKDMFEDLLPSHILFDEVIRKNELFIILTECDAQGRRIVILKLGAWNPGICTLQEFFRAAFVALEYHLLDERLQIAGIVVVVDAGGYSLAHVRHYTPFEIRKLIKLAQVASAAQKVLLPPAGGARSARRRRGLGALEHPPRTTKRLFRRAMKTLSSRRLRSKDAASLYTVRSPSETALIVRHRLVSATSAGTPYSPHYSRITGIGLLPIADTRNLHRKSSAHI